MSETYVIEGKFYQKGWIIGFYGSRNRGHFTLPACLQGSTFTARM